MLEVKQELQNSIGRIECHVDSIVILTRDEDTPFTPFYKLFLGKGARAPILCETPKERYEPTTFLPENESKTGPQNLDEFVAENVVGSHDKKAPVKPFFNSAQETWIAIDKSGSTSGSILTWSVNFVTNVIAGNRDEKAFKERVIGWGSSANIYNISEINSFGGTRPETIFEILPSSCRNLLITTDGQIPSVTETSKCIANSGVKNVIAILVAGSSFRERPVARFDISVFFPFWDHCARVGGSFVLGLVSGEAERIFILKKHIGADATDPFPPTVEEYTENTTWSEIPEISAQLLKSFQVSLSETKSSTMQLPGVSEPVDVSGLFSRLSKTMEKRGAEWKELLGSTGMDAFICTALPDIIEDIIHSAAVDTVTLRRIIEEWKKIKFAAIRESHVPDANLTSELAEFDKLSGERLAGKISQEHQERLSVLADSIASRSKEIYSKNERQRSIVQRVTTALLTAISSSDDNSSLPDSFSLGSVAKYMSNRSKRAKIVIDTAQESDWDMSGATLVNVQPEGCLICARDDQPAALLAVRPDDEEFEKILSFNLSDLGIDDALQLGHLNAKIFPAGTLCVSCAYACQNLGRHPLTRQAITAVIPCVDLGHGKNCKKLEGALCKCLFDGLCLPSTWLVFLGVLNELQIEQRFPDQIIESFTRSVLTNTRTNFFPEGMGTTETVANALTTILGATPIPGDAASWLVPMRQKSIVTAALMCKLTLKYVSQDPVLTRKCETFLRRSFFSRTIERILNVGKKNQGDLLKLRMALESDVYDMANYAPGVNTQKTAHVEGSMFLDALFGTKAANAFKRSLADTLPMFKMKTIDDFIDPGTFSSFLTFVYEEIMCKDANTVQTSLEDFLRKWVVKEKSKLLGQLFFTTDEITEDSALERIFHCAPFYKAYDNLMKLETGDHKMPLQFASHLYSPPVSHCGSCGKSFLDKTIREKIKARTISFNSAAEILKAERSKHLSKHFGFKPNTTAITETTAVTSLHKVVRTVCETKFPLAERPTREIIQEVLKTLRRRNQFSGMSVSKFCFIVLAVAWDYLKKRAKLHKGCTTELLTIADRLRIEVEHNELSGGGVATLDGLTAEEVEECTAPFTPTLDDCQIKPPTAKRLKK